MSFSNRSDLPPARPSDKAQPSTQVAQEGTPWGDIHKQMSSKPSETGPQRDNATYDKEAGNSDAEKLVKKNHAELSKATGMPIRTSAESFDAMGKQAVDQFKKMDAQMRDPKTPDYLRKETITEMSTDLKMLGIPTQAVPGSKHGEIEPVKPLTPESMTQAIIKNYATREGLTHGHADEFMKNLSKLNPADKEKQLKKLEYGNARRSEGTDTD